MRIKALVAPIAIAFLSVGNAAASTTLNDYINQSIESSYRIKSLSAQHGIDAVKLEQEQKYYLPSFKIDHTTKMHMMDGVEQVGIRPWDNRMHESNITLRSTVWRDNHANSAAMLGSRAEASLTNVEIEKSNIRAQITTAIYNIALYEMLIQKGEKILAKAKHIDRDIKKKVKGGLAKSSDATTAEVLIIDMDNAILAANLKIKQLKLNLEQVSGIPYPENIHVSPDEINALISKVPSGSIHNNKALRKKALEAQAANSSIKAAENWVSVDLYAKSKAENLTFNRFESEVGVMVTMDIFNPVNYFKDKSATYLYQSERYLQDQMTLDLQLTLESQLSILNSNRSLLASQEESVAVKLNLIEERQNEYQINMTSLYELIQAWSGYYVAIQQKTDTEATLINTMLSIDILTGEV